MPFVCQGPRDNRGNRRRVHYRPNLDFANNQLESRPLLSLYVLSYVNLVDGPYSASSPTDSPISVDAHGVGDASASADENSLSVEASGGDGLPSGSNASANGSWSFQILGVPANVSIPLTFTYEFVGSNVAMSTASTNYNLSLSSYNYTIYSGVVTQSGSEQITSQNGQIVYQNSSAAQAPGSITASFSGNGYLSAAIEAQATSTPGSAAVASAKAVFQLEGVSSSLLAQYPGMSLLFDNGDTVPVQPNLLSSQSLKDNGPDNATPGNKQSGDPIDVNTGNVYRSVEDYSTAGLNPLAFTRYYNTYIGATDAATSLGERWHSTYDRFIHLTSPTTAIAERATGQELAFTLSNGVWMSDSDEDYRLTQTASGWTLTDPQDNIETYTDNGSGLGWLSTIQARDGYTQTLHYNVRQQLASVSDSYGRSLIFAYRDGLLNTLTTPDGTTISYGYTGIGATLRPNQLASVTYPTSPPTSRCYDYYPNGTLKDAIDQDGNREASFAYDQWNRATLVYAGGNTAIDSVAVAYNDSDGSRTVTDALGLRTVYAFTTLQGVPKVTEIDRQPAGGPVTTSRFSYDANGYQASSTDWNGNLTLYANDAHGQPTAITEAAGTPLARTTLITYLSGFHLPTLIVAPGETTGFAYDGKGDLLTLTQTDTTTQTVPYANGGQQRVWTYSYDALGHVLTADGPRTDVNDKTTYVYDVLGDLIKSTDALGHSTFFTSYNQRDLPVSEADANGVVTFLAYDPMGRLLTRTVQTAAGNAVTRYGYDAAGLLTSVTQPDNSVLDYAYDSAQRLIQVSDPAGESIGYTLDGMGNTIRQDTRNSAGVIVETQLQVFNQLNQPVQSIGALPTEITRYTYDADGNVTSTTDPLGNTTTQAFDALNRLVSVTDALGGVTQYGYDAQNQNTSVIDPLGLTTSYVYDGFGDVIQGTSPNTGTTVYRLDPAGNVTSQTDARGIVTNFTYDAVNRITSKTYPTSPGENVTYSYDGTAGGNDGTGRLTGYIDQTGSTSLTYDALGDVTNDTETVGGIVSSTSYKYNLAGNETQITYPSGLIVNYSYDSQGRVNGVSASHYSSMPAPAVSLASHVTYQPFGPLASFTYGNGLVMTRSYDADYRLTGITTKSAKTTVQNVSIGYDADGNVTSITDAMTPGNNQTFTYDALNRLKTASGAYSTVSYSYDADSNRLTSTQGGVTQTYSYSPTSDLLMSITGGSGGPESFTYTADGNIATDTSASLARTYAYSNGNRLSQAAIAGGATATYLYNALGERLTETVGNTVTQFHYNQSGQLIAESNGATGATSNQYVWLGNIPLAQIAGNGSIYSGMIDYIQSDQTNTPQKMTNAAQAVVWDRKQQPFGETTSTTGIASCDLRGPGQVADPVSGLDYNVNRDYDPALGRYVEADPIGLAGGINDYGYVGQSPLISFDTYGLSYSIPRSYLPPSNSSSVDPQFLQQMQLTPTPSAKNACSADSFQVAGTPMVGPAGGSMMLPGPTLRVFDMNGNVSYDIDYGHDHGAGSPHAHNWDGGIRGPGVPISLWR